MNYAADPLYRALLAEVADLEWQIVEDEFLQSIAARPGDVQPPSSEPGVS